MTLRDFPRRTPLVRAMLLTCAFAALAAAPAPAATTFGATGPGAVATPAGLAIGNGGAVYVADVLNSRVVKFTSSGEFVKTWGSFGIEHGNPPVFPEDGQFGYLPDVATDASGNVYALDDQNHRVQKFDADGAFLDKWSGGGEGLASPWGVAVDGSGNVYVADANGRHVQKFTGSGAFLLQWGSIGSGDGQFETPTDVATDSDGDVYVSDYGRGTIEKFSSSGAFLSRWGLAAPGELVVDSTDHVFVINTQTHRIVKFTRDGTRVGVLEPADYGGGCAASLAFDGPDTIYVGASDDNPAPGDCSGPATGRVVKLDLAEPTAAMSAPDLALTGRAVQFDASESHVPFASIESFEWDLDGDGSFETDTGASDHASHVYDDPGPVTVRVRVRSAQGKTDEASATVGIRRAPPPGPIGASIENGARFTNDPHVQVTLRWPVFARAATISNDGGFSDSRTTPVLSPSEWTLDSTGPERLPKTIYVRFDDSTQTFQDDIILDETNPAVRSAELTPVGGSDLEAADAHKRTYRLRLKATDNVSGVARMQVTADRHRPGKFRKYRKQSKVRLAGKRAYVRVRDAAGNRSRWRKVTAD